MALATKLMLIGGVFLVLALASIGLTLWVTWQLEGGAAAVNEAGRMRMRSYQLALSLQQKPVDAPTQWVTEVSDQVTSFDRSVALLRRGDSSRPLAVPWDEETRTQFRHLVTSWQTLRSQALAISEGAAEANSLNVHVQGLVAQVDLFVSAVERHLSGWTTLLRTFQLAMMVLAILSALALMYAGYVFILEPVSRLKSALHDIEDGDFATRVIVETGDEMGSLAEGFNSMAENLQSLYGNLETKVREKTASLETKQQRLSALYEVAAFVASAETLEELAHGFARHMRRIAQADAVAIRWSDVANERYVLLGSDCLPHVMA
ncbi:MAG: type IV pili methyl-accepting chemotaxis transducer N-terminal domain-containing protein, partial [Aquabacterium sp.]|nr:type IV pili methyl-accepting chemotaxis transducer N-terminal domain-containing protein [Aquabacterium sp.]